MEGHRENGAGAVIDLCLCVEQEKLSIRRKMTTVDIRMKICLCPSVRGFRVWRMKSLTEKRRSGCESQYCKNSCGASVGSQ